LSAGWPRPHYARTRALRQQPAGRAGHRGFFVDPTPRDNSEYLRYTSERVNLDSGWLNTGRVFSDATGHAADCIDLLTIAMHEIGHALGLDGNYSGFLTQFHSGLFADVTSPRTRVKTAHQRRRRAPACPAELIRPAKSDRAASRCTGPGAGAGSKRVELIGARRLPRGVELEHASFEPLRRRLAFPGTERGAVPGTSFAKRSRPNRF